MEVYVYSVEIPTITNDIPKVFQWQRPRPHRKLLWSAEEFSVETFPYFRANQTSKLHVEIQELGDVVQSLMLYRFSFVRQSKVHENGVYNTSDCIPSTVPSFSL